MPTVRRQETREIFGQSLSDTTVSAFEHQVHCDVVIVSAEGERLRAHQVRPLTFTNVARPTRVQLLFFQVVLAKSPTLSAALKLSEIRRLPEAIVMLPDFKKQSLILLLQFLYTGEVGTIRFCSLAY